MSNNELIDLLRQNFQGSDPLQEKTSSSLNDLNNLNRRMQEDFGFSISETKHLQNELEQDCLIPEKKEQSLIQIGLHPRDSTNLTLHIPLEGIFWNQNILKLEKSSPDHNLSPLFHFNDRKAVKSQYQYEVKQESDESVRSKQKSLIKKKKYQNQSEKEEEKLEKDLLPRFGEKEESFESCISSLSQQKDLSDVFLVNRTISFQIASSPKILNSDDISMRENSEEPPKKKKYKPRAPSKKLNGKLIELKKYRGDVVLKTILRLMRRTYLEKFLQMSTFSKIKKDLDPKVFYQHLQEFIKLTFFDQKQEKRPPSLKGLSFFLGAMFNPKLMKQMSKGEQEQVEIDKIHNTLYSFSASKIEFLNSYKAYQYIMRHFSLNYKEQLINDNQTMKKSKEDFMKGFQYLEKYYS